MPALSGSQQAYRQARSAIMRSGASRCGYYYPNLVVTLDGDDASCDIADVSTGFGPSVELTLNEEPDRATFTLTPTSTLTPVPHMPITIGLGTADNLIFGGQISRVTHTPLLQAKGSWRTVECLDWTKLFDKGLVLKRWASMTIDEIVIDLVTSGTPRWVDERFTVTHVETGLPTLDSFIAIDERPSSILTRLVGLNGGGGWYIDADMDVHFFGPAGETGGTPPVSLTNSSSTLKAISWTQDGSQVRNVVYGEGKSTKILVAVPAGTLPSPKWLLPVENASIFDYPVTIDHRADQQTLGVAVAVLSFRGWTERPWALTTADAAVGDTSISVVDNALLFAGGYSPSANIANGILTDGAQYFMTLGINDLIPGTISSIPASGYGALTQDIPAGTILSMCDAIVFNGGGDIEAINEGTALVVRTSDGDASEQTDMQALEGGDGGHFHKLTDGEVDADQLYDIVVGEVDAFAETDGLFTADFVTTDLNARPGAQQAIAITGDDALSTTLTITEAELTWPVPNSPPFRQCKASTVRLADLSQLTADATKGHH